MQSPAKVTPFIRLLFPIYTARLASYSDGAFRYGVFHTPNGFPEITDGNPRQIRARAASQSHWPIDETRRNKRHFRLLLKTKTER